MQRIPIVGGIFSMLVGAQDEQEISRKMVGRSFDVQTGRMHSTKKTYTTKGQNYDNSEETEGETGGEGYDGEEESDEEGSDDGRGEAVNENESHEEQNDENEGSDSDDEEENPEEEDEDEEEENSSSESE